MPSSKIGKYISILNRQSQKYLHHLVEQYGIGYSSYYFVMYIGANPKCSQREMCDSMAMDQAMATREMRRLEKSGYIIREKRPGNAKRRKTVSEAERQVDGMVGRTAGRERNRSGAVFRTTANTGKSRP